MANVVRGGSACLIRFSGSISGMPAGFKRWLRLFEQIFWFDKWNACRVQAAAICGGQLK